MKKAKRTLILLVIILIPASASVLAYLYIAGLSYNCYDLCENIAITDNGGIYTMYGENDALETIKLDSAGLIDIMRSDMRVSRLTEMEYALGAFNCDGVVLEVKYAIDKKTGQTLRQMIYKLEDDLSRTRFYTYEGEAAAISYLTGNEGKLFVTLLDGHGQRAYVDTFDLNGASPAQPSTRLEFSSPFNDRFYKALYLNGSLYASTMSGEVLRCLEGGGSVNVLQSSAHDDVPYGIIEAFGSDGNGVFFFDAMDGFYYYIDSSARLERRENPAVDSGEHAYALAVEGPYSLALITKKNADVMRVAFDGNVTAEITELRLAPKDIILKLAQHALFYTLAGYALALLTFILIKVIKKSNRLLTKFLLIITPLTLLAFAAFGYFQHTRIQNMLLQNKDNLSRHYNQLVAGAISYEELEAIKDPQFYKSPEYRRLQDKLQIHDGLDTASVKSDVFILRDGELFAGVSLDWPCLFLAKDLLTADKLKRFDEIGDPGAPVTFEGHSMGGDWSITIGVIDDADYSGQLKGYVMTWVSHNDIVGLLNENDWSFARLALVTILTLLVFLTLIFKIALRPISNLHNAMQKVLAGDYEVKLGASTKDEFMRINLAFNKMCSDLRTHMYKLERISDSYYRFVPRNILPILNKESILDVDCGDSKRLSSCCCALCTHNLPDLQAAGTDEDFLKYVGVISNFINNSLQRHGGILMSAEINLRGLLAIFPSSAEGCREFACDVRQFCAMEHSRFSNMSPEITTILHRADMFYGITGINDAAFPFLLSDKIDFIMRTLPLFAGTKVRIVATQDILPELGAENYMEIGWREALTGGACKLYVPADVKSEADESFEKGLNCFYRKDFYSARALFSSVWKANPSNGIAQWYALAADKYLDYPHQFVSSQLFGTDIYKIDF